MIHTHRRYCIFTGWMTDGDRSHEVEVRREQENRNGWSIQHTSIEWLINKIQCHAEIISNNNNYSKVYSHKKESLCQLVALSLQQSGVYSWQVPFSLLRGACSRWM